MVPLGGPDPETTQRLWRGAIAIERALPRSALVRLGGDAGVVDAFVDAEVTAGRIVRGGAARDPLLALRPEEEQPVVRELVLRGELHTVARATRALLEGRSVAEVTTALADGDLEAFLRRAAAPRLPHPAPCPAAELLRRAVVEPFDADAFVATWGDDAVPVALRVLEDAADAPARCEPLRAWAERRLGDGDLPAAQVTALSAVLAAHAILAGDVDAAAALAARLPPDGAAALRAAACVVAGDLGGAQRMIDAGASRGRGRGAHAPSIAPLLALVTRSRDLRDGDAVALKWLSGSRTDAQRGAARALRLVLRTLADPDAPPRRLHVHQLDPGAGAWETLLTALAVHLGGGLSPTRAGWAQHVTRSAVAWRDAGATWLAAQAMALAHTLDPAIARAERERLGAGDVGAPPALVVWDLASPTPEWKRALHALAAVASAAATAEGDRRAVWVVDLAAVRLARPALQELRPDSGWTRGERLDVAALEAIAGALPPEDRRVLLAARTGPGGERELGPDAFEALIGHPRVVDGARGMTPVEVVRGACRVETHDDDGVIRVVVEPRVAAAGVHVVRDGEARLVVHRVTDAMRAVMDVLPRGMTVPRSGEAELVEVLGRLAAAIEIRSPLVGAERDVAADATPCLRIAPHVGAWAVQVGVRPFGALGRFFVAGDGPASVSHDEAGRRLRTVRDLALERARVERLVTACPSLEREPEIPGVPDEGDGADDAWIVSEEALLVLLAEVRDSGEACTFEWPESPPLRLRGAVGTRSLAARLRCKKGWYLATGGVRLDDVTTVALSELVRAPFVGRGRFVRLPGGDVVEIEARVRRVVAALRAASEGEGGELRVHPGALGALRDLAGTDVSLDLDDEARTWLDRLARRQAPDVPVPGGLRATLRSYQVDGFRWLAALADLGLGACLADDMGLGKTVQILALLLARAGDGPALVVAPTSVCSNWVAELRRFAPELEVAPLLGPDRAARLEALAAAGAGRVAITSYAILQQDVDRLAAITWGTAVLDEAQFIKNAESLRARAACRLQARHRVAATGTPVENHLGDLWSIFHFLTPGLLGGWDAFRRRFARPIERDDDDEARAALRALVRPYVLRRTKADVLAELPPVTEIRHDVHLSASDALRYAWLRKQVHDKLFTPAGKRGNKIEVLAEITRLRRFCCHPRLVMPDAGGESAKIAALLELAVELRDGGHRALVFSQYVDFLGLVREQLDERGLSYEYLDGATPQAERAARVAAFQDGHATLFLVSLKAGGFGLNLTAADYVIHLDPWWNPAVEAQATDRAHRIGQSRPVTVYRLVTRDTIEEKIVDLHAGKRRLARSILDDGERTTAAIDDEDLAALLDDEDAPPALEGGPGPGASPQSSRRRVTSS